MTQPGRWQPYLHDLLVAVRAPAFALSEPDGQLGRRPGATGCYLNDRRIISTSLLALAGAELSPILGESDGADGSRSVLVARGLGDPGADPTVWLERRRRVHAEGADETIELHSAARAPVRTSLTVRLACDLAELPAIKSGRPALALPAVPADGGLRWHGPDGTEVSVLAGPPALVAGDQLAWDVELLAGRPVRIELRYRVAAEPVPPVAVAPTGPSLLGPLRLDCADRRLARLTARSLADLAALELADPQSPADRFLAAGAPWYLTLFGRDSLIAARMLLPLGTELAAGTLRTLARRQGRRVDPEAAEEPGKIPHEIRRAPADFADTSRADQQLRLPPVYYGTVDATPLWVLLLHDSWRWGMPTAEVAALLDPLERALAWLRDYGMDGSGFLRYADSSGHGLVNQGWKDSHDAIQFADGRLARAPVALAEVQAYGYAAARCGADLLAAFDRPGAADWRRWAVELAERFRAAFWVPDRAGDYPALALDAGGDRVDGLASNLGHLLGTGLLEDAESELVVRRLASPELSSGFGLRTLAGSSAGFNPLSYHAGSVWTHDTAIAIDGLATVAGQVAGAAEAAGALIEGLLAAGEGFDYRLPELFGGQPADPAALLPRPTPYPASCRPQAWSAASALAVLSAVLGPRPDAPAGRLAFRPLAGQPVGPVRVSGLRFAGRPLTVQLTADGRVEVG
ncbi:MAG TPA: glycogen debranching N-terminal domain-containing protein [Jatrophihabitans sp.]|nr:glycogen debranching N-terminal domain-containing protein [Jatrophihabitans sp.]